MALNPLLINNFSTPQQALSSVPLIPWHKPPYDENWLQDLIHQNPQLVPAGEVEAAFEEIIPVVRELPLPSGFLDNLYITPDGYPVLVEVKLWKNQEARRKVIAQILEYAKDFANLKYDDLNVQIRKLLKGEAWGDNPLYEIARRATPHVLEESAFVDRVSRNMREGRFLLLILGDGVREDMASLANYLMHHSLRYAFGIVQIKLFTLPDGSVIAMPDIMARTQTIERHVTVVFTPEKDAHITDGNPTPSREVLVGEPEKTSLSLDDFFEKVSESAPESLQWLKTFIQGLSDTPVELQVGKNGDGLMLKAPFGNRPTLLYISPQSVTCWAIGSPSYTKTGEGSQIVRAYIDRIATLVGGEVKAFPAGGLDIKVKGQSVPLQALRGKDTELKEAMNTIIQEMTVQEEMAA